MQLSPPMNSGSDLDILSAYVEENIQNPVMELKLSLENGVRNVLKPKVQCLHSLVNFQEVSHSLKLDAIMPKTKKDEKIFRPKWYILKKRRCHSTNQFGFIFFKQ